MIAMREITKAEQEIYKETAKILKGTDRRVFIPSRGSYWLV